MLVIVKREKSDIQWSEKKVWKITVARNVSIAGLDVCSGGLDILKFDQNSTDL